MKGVAFHVTPVSKVYIHSTITQSEELTTKGGGRGKVVIIATTPKLSPKGDL